MDSKMPPMMRKIYLVTPTRIEVVVLWAERVLQKHSILRIVLDKKTILYLVLHKQIILQLVLQKQSILQLVLQNQSIL